MTRQGDIEKARFQLRKRAFLMGDTGLEPKSKESSQTPVNTKDKALTDNSERECRVRNRVQISTLPPELQQIIDRWDGLPEHIKQLITETVRSVRVVTDE